MLRFCYIILFGLLGYHTMAQTGPGGVGTNTNNLLWLDVTGNCLNNNLNPATNNQIIKRILDRSGNGNFMNQANLSRMATLKTNELNGLSVVRLDGTADQYTGNLSAGTLSEIDVFTVGNFGLATQPAGKSACFYLLGSSNSSSINFLRANANSGANADKYYSKVEGSNRFGELLDNTSHVYSQRFETTTPFHFVNVDGTAQTVAAHNSIITVSSNFYVGTAVGTNSCNLNGDIAELIVFEGINRSQRIIVENYLGAKYNLALSTNDKFSFDATHGFEVAGIGRESATDNNVDARGSGFVQISSPTGLEDGEYMLWGHDNGDTSTSGAEVPPAWLNPIGEKLNREWRVEISGGDNSVGSVTLTFHLPTGKDFGLRDSTYNLLIDDDGDFTNASIVNNIPVVTDDTIIVFSGITLSDGDFFTLGNSNDAPTCASLSSGDWQAVNWDCGVIPDSSYNVEVRDGTTVSISASATESAKSIDIMADAGSGGGTLTLNLSANLVMTGIFDVQSIGGLNMNLGSTVTLRGQTINQPFSNNSGRIVELVNLIVDNPLGVILQDSFSISENLDLLDGDLTNNGHLLFLSDNLNTSAIGATPKSNTINGTGTFAVQRFRNTRNTNWGNIATSGVDTDLEDLNGEVFMSGIFGGNGYAFNSTNTGGFNSVYFWNETTNAYEVPINTSEPFEIGRGYEIWLGTNQTTWTGQAWELEGDIDLSPINIPVSSAGGGWNLLGNPYLGVLNFDNIVADGGVNGSEYWYVDANTSTYISVAAGGATLPPGQGFWVNTTGINIIALDPATDLVPNITLTNYLKRDMLKDELRIMAHHKNEPYGSAVYLRRDENAYEGLDERDLSPLRLPDPNFSELSIEAGHQDLMVNYIPSNANQIEIPIRFDTKYDGDYELSFEGLETFEVYSCVSIRDEANSEITPIIDESILTMSNLTVGDEVNYTLILSKDGFEDCTPLMPSSEIFNDGLVNIWNANSIVKIDFALDKAAMSEIAVYDVLGNIIHTSALRAKFNRVEIPLLNQPSGVYFVSVNINGQNWSQKIVKY